MPSKVNLDLIESAKAQGGQVVYAANLDDLAAKSIVDMDLVMYKQNEILDFPKEIDYEAGQLQKRDFGGKDAYYLVLENKIVYLSTFLKSVQPYDKETNTPKDVPVVTAGNAFYDKCRKCGDYKKLLELLIGKKLKVSEVKTEIGPRWKDGAVVGTKRYQIPVFVEVTDSGNE